MTKKIVKRTDANNETLYFYTHSDAVDVGEGSSTKSLTEVIDDTLHKSAQTLTNAEKTQVYANLGLNGVDDVPTDNSNNVVRSGGVKAAIDDVIDDFTNRGFMYKGIAPASAPLGEDKTFYIAKSGDYTAYTGIGDGSFTLNGIAVLTYATTTASGAWTKNDIVLFDEEPTAGSDNLVKSGGVKQAIRDTTLISSDASSLIGSWIVDNTNVAFEGTGMDGVFTSLTNPDKPAKSRPYFSFRGFKSGSKYRLQLKVNINSSRSDFIGFIYAASYGEAWDDYRMIDADSGRNADVYDGYSLDCVFVAESNKQIIAFSLNQFGIGDTVTISDFSISEVQDVLSEIPVINETIDEFKDEVAETRLMVVGSKKNYIVGKKYSNSGSLVDDPDYTAITELIPVDGGSTVTFSLGTSILLFNANKGYDDYFEQKSDPRTVTLKNTSVFIGVSFPTSRLSNVSLVINGVNHPIVLTEDVLGAAEARGTSFEKDGSFIDSGYVQGAITELSNKMFPSSFVFGKMLTQTGAIVDSADGGYCTEFIKVQPSQKIVFNTRTAGEGRIAIVVYYASKAAFNYYSQTAANRLITLPSKSAYIRFNYDNSMLNQFLLTDPAGNSLISFDGILNGNFIRYYDEEELGANNVQDAIKAIVKEVRNPDIDIVKMYKDKEYTRNNLVFKSDFSCFFFSDVHGSVNNVNRIVSLAKDWREYVDCIINSGDTTLNNSAESIVWYQNIVNAAGQDGVEILTAIGNHDAYTPTGSDGSLNSYNKYIKPTIDNVPDIVQPADAGTVGKCYYYKDYNEKVRVIVLDAYRPNAYWDSDEESWLISVLADALTNNLAVLCVNHVPPTEENFTRIPCTFNSVLSVGRWVISPGALMAVDNFIDNGGIFAGWLCGHTHYDVFGHPTGKAGQHMFITMSARYDYGPNGFDTPRSVDDTKIDYDSFNLVAVDTENSLFKVLRIGVNLDFKMHTKNVLVYDYANREVISNW